MPVLVRIALRNMLEHRAKSLIIGTLVALGTIVIVLGNALIDSSAEGIRKSFIESYTGDVMLHGPSENTVSVFGVESRSPDEDFEVPTVPGYEDALARARSDPRTAAAAGMVVAYGMLTVDADESFEEQHREGRDNIVFAILFGVEPDSYFKLFPALKLLEGRYLRGGEPEIMLTRPQIAKLEKKYKRTFKAGDKLLVTGVATAGFRIRETTIAGIYSREDEGTAASPAPFVIADADTARVLGGLTLASAESVKLEPAQTALLAAADDPDALFSEEGAGTVAKAAPAAKTAAGRFSSAAGLLGDTSARERLNAADSGAWNFILIRLKDSGDAKAVIAETRAWAAGKGLDLKAEDWKGAAGSFGKVADVTRVIFVAALLIVSVVAIIIMMNTLVISVIERTAEIGAMRALGAPRSFVRSMFLTETLTLTLVFGAVGSILALAAAAIVNACGIEAGNDLLELLYGGKVLHLVPRWTSFATTLAMVFVVAFLAHLYPVRVALKIPPVQAMQTE